MARALRSGGFTLLEILVVMAIMAGMMAVAYGFFSTALRDSDLLAQHASRLEAEQRALAFLTMDFEQVVARPARDSFGEVQSAVGSLQQGGVAVTRLGWANPFDLRHRSQLQRVFYQLDNGRLLRRHFPTVDTNSGAEVQELVLIEDVSEFQVRFLERTEAGEWQWHEEWPTVAMNQMTNKLLMPLPASVEVQITLESGRELHRYFRLPVNPWL